MSGPYTEVDMTHLAPAKPQSVQFVPAPPSVHWPIVGGAALLMVISRHAYVNDHSVFYLAIVNLPSADRVRQFFSQNHSRFGDDLTVIDTGERFMSQSELRRRLEQLCRPSVNVLPEAVQLS